MRFCDYISPFGSTNQLSVYTGIYIRSYDTILSLINVRQEFSRLNHLQPNILIYTPDNIIRYVILRIYYSLLAIMIQSLKRNISFKESGISQPSYYIYAAINNYRIARSILLEGIAK